MESCSTSDSNSATVIRGADTVDTMRATGVYHIECIGPDGQVKWRDIAPNVVTNQGKNAMLDTYFAGSSYTAAWYMSLITNGSANSGSTYASPTVTETTSSIIAARVAMSWSTASGGTKSAGTTSFSIIGGPATITGNMIVSGGAGVTTVANTAASGGVLFSSAAFSAGNKIVSNNDTLNISYSVSV